MSERKYTGDHCGRGELPGGVVASEDALGPCPGCDADLTVSTAINPDTGKRARVLLHPMPFCHYYGATDPTKIEIDVLKARSLS